MSLEIFGNLTQERTSNSEERNSRRKNIEYFIKKLMKNGNVVEKGIGVSSIDEG